jgi:ArsR family transcriptional regulator
MRNLLNIFKALSDETRVRILKLLESGELCICKIMEVLDMKQSRISRHMGILKNAGLVVDRRDGKWVHYSLNPNPEGLCCKKVIYLLGESLKDQGVITHDREKLKRLLEKEKKGLWRPSSKCSVGVKKTKGSRVQEVKGSSEMIK